jgi:spore coat polysaccharide biosynthesis protein SpsF (cytidylyltransferase family)
MITAIINVRSSSERLPLKHLMKIGNKTIIEHIIEKLSKVKKINKIYIATGAKKKN